MTDPDIGPILQLKETSDEYPDFRAVSAESCSVKALRQHWRHLFVHNGVLYRRVEKEDQSYTQLVLPSGLRPVVLQQLHNCPTAGHLGTYKTLDRIKRRFYWVGWRRHVMRYVSHCTACNTVKRPHTKRKVPLTPAIILQGLRKNFDRFDWPTSLHQVWLPVCSYNGMQLYKMGGGGVTTHSGNDGDC